MSDILEGEKLYTAVQVAKRIGLYDDLTRMKRMAYAGSQISKAWEELTGTEAPEIKAKKSSGKGAGHHSQKGYPDRFGQTMEAMLRSIHSSTPAQVKAKTPMPQDVRELLSKDKTEMDDWEPPQEGFPWEWK
jgi:hypothetical protein